MTVLAPQEGATVARMATVDLQSPDANAFTAARHLATLTTLRPDGTPHVVPVGFTWDGEFARVITSATSVKVSNVRQTGRVVLCQVDGGRWLSIEGTAQVVEDPEEIALAVSLYTRRYRTPRDNPSRVALRVRPERVLGRV